jgi:hypothetical protein
MNRSRWIIAIVIALVALLALGRTAGAQDGPAITLSPESGLADGDTVTVTITGFPADATSFQSGQCVTPLEDFLSQCDLGNIVPVPLDGDGAATIEVVVHEGAIGSGTCGEGADQCVIAVGSLTDAEAAAAPIFFGADGAATDEPAEEEPVAEELAVTGPREVGISLVAGFAVLVAGFMIISTSRRRFLA